MKKLLLFMIAVGIMIGTANATFTKVDDESKNNLAVNNAPQKTADRFTKMSRKEFEQLSGRHLSLVERIAFRLTQKKLRKQTDDPGTTKKFNIGWFAIGLLAVAAGLLLTIAFDVIGLILVAGATVLGFIFLDNKNLRRWFLAGILAGLLLLIGFALLWILTYRD